MASTDDKKQLRALKKELKNAQDREAGLIAEVDELKRLLVDHNPKALTKSLAPSVSKYTPDLIDPLLARGMIGMLPDECRAVLGVSKVDWVTWRIENAAFGQAVNRYMTLARAYWLGQSRLALASGNWQFNHEKVHRMLESAFKGEDLDADGDASRLVHIDLGLDD